MSIGYFNLLLESKPFTIPSRFNRLSDLPLEIYNILVFDRNHQYIIQSKVSEEVLKSFINYLVNEKTPDITDTNFFEYYQLNQEFNILNELIQSKKNEFSKNFAYIKLIQNADKEYLPFIEEQISLNLDEYLTHHGEELMNLPIQTLYNIFSHPKVQFNQHDLAYTLIQKVYKQTNNQAIFSLLPTIDGMKLSKENIVNSLISKKEHCGIVPTFGESFIEKSVEKQNQMENQIISLKMILGNQQKLIENFMTEITAIKQKQDKLLEEFQKSKQEEINQAENSKKEMMTEIKAIKQKQEKLLEEFQKSKQEEINQAENSKKEMMTEIKAIKLKQEKLLEEFQKSKQEEINQAENSKKEMMTEIEAVKQKKDKLLEELNQEEDASDLNEEDIDTIMMQSSVSRRRAIKALREANGDLVTAVVNLAL